jgi:ATP-dependent Zn protease
MSTNDKRHAAAAHEAGHAVVGLALGLDIVEVWIDDNGYGQTRFSADSPELLDHLTLAAAGGMANRAFDIEAPTDMLANDHTKITSLLAGRSEDEDARLRVAGRKRARELLTPNLALLRAVANELETVGKIDHARLEELVRRRGLHKA